MASGTDALSRCKECIDARESFLLKGGAGSGKTEALKELLLYIKNTKPGASVVCITQTNAAVNEIVNRVGADYSVSTIHSFLYSLIGYYRKNIKQALPSLFLLETVEANSSDHKEYKKRFEKYIRKYFDMYNASGANPVQKRVYDNCIGSSMNGILMPETESKHICGEFRPWRLLSCVAYMRKSNSTS